MACYQVDFQAGKASIEKEIPFRGFWQVSGKFREFPGETLSPQPRCTTKFDLNTALSLVFVDVGCRISLITNRTYKSEGGYPKVRTLRSFCDHFTRPSSACDNCRILKSKCEREAHDQNCRRCESEGLGKSPVSS
jgi:hypothetical protein